MIMLLKLITGDDVVADVTIEGNEYSLKNPMRFMPAREGVGMMPLSFFAKPNVPIMITKDKIVFTTQVEDEIANAYNEKFGSGIVLPVSSLQL